MRPNGAALFLLLIVPLAQLPYSNPELGFAMTLPAGFRGEGEDPLNLRAIACFVGPGAEGQRGWVRVCVERRGGALPRGAERMTFAWKGLDLEGAMFRSEWAAGRVREDVVVFAALVLLRKEPVWLVAMAPLADRGHAQSATSAEGIGVGRLTAQASPSRPAGPTRRSYGVSLHNRPRWATIAAYTCIPSKRFCKRRFSFAACWLLSWFTIGTVTMGVPSTSSK